MPAVARYGNGGCSIHHCIADRAQLAYPTFSNIESLQVYLRGNGAGPFQKVNNIGSQSPPGPSLQRVQNGFFFTVRKIPSRQTGFAAVVGVVQILAIRRCESTKSAAARDLDRRVRWRFARCAAHLPDLELTAPIGREIDRLSIR